MKKVKVLLAEDSEADARLIAQAFKDRQFEYVIETANNGEDAVNYLFGRGNHRDARRPDIIILDIKMPKKDGKEVLKEIKSSVSLKDVPVIMLTNSDSKTDIIDSYEHQANSYITKPLSVVELIEIVNYIEDTWLRK